MRAGTTRRARTPCLRRLECWHGGQTAQCWQALFWGWNRDQSSSAHRDQSSSGGRYCPIERCGSTCPNVAARRLQAE
eukprot:12773883-Alexandrium_andersonii.AAC.1